VYTGRIKKLVPERGFGFIATDSADVFFHFTACKTTNGAPDPKVFERLKINDFVEFEIENRPGNSLRASFVIYKNCARCNICDMVPEINNMFTVRDKSVCQSCARDISELAGASRPA
jgi:cold shock CspA family protein